MDAGTLTLPERIYGHPDHEGELVRRLFPRVDGPHPCYVTDLCVQGWWLPIADARWLRRPQGSGSSTAPIATDCCFTAIEEPGTAGDEIYTCGTSYRFDRCLFSICTECSPDDSEMDAGEISLAEEINNHPAHDQPNTLVLRRHHSATPSYCSLCRNGIEEGGRVYACETGHASCDFKVDTGCSSIKALVDFRGHEHRMVFLERARTGHSVQCYACEGFSDRLMFWCPECDYRLHLLCGPLPTSIPYHFAGYDLKLTLKDTLLDGVDAEDSWCDICEQRRDPGQCVYRSEDPPFTASTDCLLPQLVLELQGHLGAVQLRSVRGHIPGAVVVPVNDAERAVGGLGIKTEAAAEGANNSEGVFTMAQLVGEATQVDGELLQSISGELARSAEWMSSMDIEKAVRFKFTDEAFQLFKEHVDINSSETNALSWLDFWMELDDDSPYVKVGDDFVGSEWVPVYRQVIDKHGDLTADSTISPSGRAIIVAMLLQLVHGMQGLQISEITGKSLCVWQWYLEVVFLNTSGFKVQFALDNLEKVARTCYALKLIEVREGVTMDLTEQIQQLVGEIEEDKPQIEALRVQYGRAKEESVFGKQSSTKLSKLQWKSAGEFLGLDPEE